MKAAKGKQPEELGDSLTSDDFPEGWTRADLEACSTLITKGATPTSYGFEYKTSGIKFIRVENLSDGRIDRATISVYIDAAADEALRRSRLQNGDLLFSIAGTIGRTALVRPEDLPANTNQALALIRGADRVFVPSFLQVVLTSSVAQNQATNEARGGGMNNISLADVKSLRLPMPPLAEQVRIVTKVEQLLAHVNVSREHLAKVSRILKAFRQSVLAAACSGRLTEDWRLTHPSSESAALLLRRFRKQKPVKEEPGNVPFELPDPWTWAYFGELLDSIRGGSTVPPALERTDYPILRSSSVRQRFVDLTDVRYLSDDQSRNEENYIFDRDLLFTRLSGSLEYVANCGMVRDLGKRRIQYPDRLFCARLHPPLVSEYIELIFGASMVRHQIEEASRSSAGHQRVSIGDLEELLIPLPPVDEQEQIVRRVEALFKLADAIEKRVRATTLRANKLTPAILAKAFRGELVPTEAELARREGRTYEPAWELLERIKSERQKEAASKNTARRDGGQKQTPPKR